MEKLYTKFRFVAEPVTDYISEEIKVTQHTDIEPLLRAEYGDEISLRESFIVVGLNNSNNVVGTMKMFRGGTSATVVDVKLIALFLIRINASKVIISHNHPSGNMTPSVADINLTKKIKQGLALLDIELLDHIILTPDGSLSMANEGLGLI